MNDVIGIDPSLSSTGIANELEAFTVQTDAGDPVRLATIYREVHYQLTNGTPRLAVIEDLPTHAKGAGLTGMAQGVIRLALINAQVPYVAVAAATLKVFGAGRGNATKADLRMELFRRSGRDIRDDNQVDAIFLRELGLHLLGTPTFDLPQTHLRALDKVALPDGVSR